MWAESYDTIGVVPLIPEFDEANRRVFVRGSGVLRLDEIQTLIRTVRADVDHQMWPMLVDARGATTDMVDADIARLAAAVQKTVDMQGPRGHVAIVADEDVLYERMLAYESQCAALGVRVIRVFRQYADAAQWLDIVAASRNFS